MIDFNLLPFQLSYILGIPYREVLSWIDDGKLKTTGGIKRAFTVSINDLVDFLGQNRDCVGQLYCDSSVPIYNEWRKEIIEEMDKRWPFEVLN